MRNTVSNLHFHALNCHFFSSCVLQNNLMVFIAEVFWWFEIVKPDFVQPKNLQEINDGKELEPLTHRFRTTGSHETNRYCFLTCRASRQHIADICCMLFLWFHITSLLSYIIVMIYFNDIGESIEFIFCWFQKTFCACLYKFTFQCLLFPILYTIMT